MQILDIFNWCGFHFPSKCWKCGCLTGCKLVGQLFTYTRWLRLPICVVSVCFLFYFVKQSIFLTIEVGRICHSYILLFGIRFHKVNRKKLVCSANSWEYEGNWKSFTRYLLLLNIMKFLVQLFFLFLPFS